jgi:hypothetical protein
VPADQAALDALRPSASQLCASAQHALGLAVLGSQIDPAHTEVRVWAAGGLLLAFVGEGALWWVANMPPGQELAPFCSTSLRTMRSADASGMGREWARWTASCVTRSSRSEVSITGLLGHLFGAWRRNDHHLCLLKVGLDLAEHPGQHLCRAQIGHLLE